VLVHDWLCGYRGGEAVLERLAGVLGARCEVVALLVMFDDGRALAPHVDALRHVVSTLGRVPGFSDRARRWLLPLYPVAVASLGRSLAHLHARRPIDLVVSTSSAAVKGIRPPPGVSHLCYCHSPARYLWGRASAYGGAGVQGGLRGAGLRVFGPALRRWDRRTAANVSRFLANSSFIAGEVKRCYGRDSLVVHPPVRTAFFTPDPRVAREDWWLAAGALEPYKRVDLAIAAARHAGRRLVVAGTGSMEASLRAGAGEGVEFLGRVSDEQLRDLYRRAGVLLFPQVEDFGITAVEAQACGLPVAAPRAGGALDSVLPGITGAYFDAPTPELLARAADEAAGCTEVHCRRNAERFGEAVFDAMIAEQVDELVGRR
jgi:glycosyltransferase involved in cell wall biosynthesis